MSDRTINAVKYALLGTTVGTLSAVGADALYGYVVQMIAPAGGAAGPADNLGRMSLALIASSAVAAVAIYGGEQLIDLAGGQQDPLVGLFFYHTALTQMQTASVTPRIVRGLWNSAWTTIVSSPPRTGDNTVPEVLKKQGCGSMSGCGGLLL